MFRDTGLRKYVTSDGWVLLCLPRFAQQDSARPSQAATKGVRAASTAHACPVLLPTPLPAPARCRVLPAASGAVLSPGVRVSFQAMFFSRYMLICLYVES